MQQLFLKNKKKLMLGCTINVQIELKKNLQLIDLSFNIWFCKSKYRCIKFGLRKLFKLSTLD